jgi:hypothetical protein
MGEVKSAYFAVRPCEAQFEIAFAPPLRLTGGSGSRAHHVLQRMRRLIRREGWKPKLYRGQLLAVVSRNDAERLSEVLATVDAVLDKIAARPLDPHEVEEALRITARELKLWTKARRLPTSGQGSFRKGQVIFFCRYPTSAIAELAAQPEVISGWREDDLRSEARGQD